MRENRNVPFRDWNIRVSRNHNGQLHICAVDICDILKRDELLENGAIARVCPTALKISFRKKRQGTVGFPSHRYAPAFTTGTQGDYYTP
ncbi:hypothetical protein [Bacteroides caccae]|uniref:hypothetical protein n=1 Tax=Bacteroides caccae TaxID=47678 RepID=UPI001CCC358E|nr:hypothetical protein [Bacteroides caccae]